jgi:hypothetical protein
MRIALIRIAASFAFAALVVKVDAFAQLIKLNVGYVGITSDNAMAFIARFAFRIPGNLVSAIVFIGNFIFCTGKIVRPYCPAMDFSHAR